MEGIAAVTARIGEIQGRLASFAAQPVPHVAPTAQRMPSVSSGAQPTASASFASALSQASGNPTPGSTPIFTASRQTAAWPAATPATLQSATMLHSGTALQSATGLPSAPLLRSGTALLSAPVRALQPPGVREALASPGAGRRYAKGPPPELLQYGNGKIPKEALSGIGHGSHRLWAPAAAAFTRMEAAAARDGIKIKLTDSYRSYETQVDLVKRKGLYSQGGLAAKPGTSEHGWGKAVDLDLNSRAQAWMRANAGRFGFVEDTPREPWHWGFHG